MFYLRSINNIFAYYASGYTMKIIL